MKRLDQLSKEERRAVMDRTTSTDEVTPKVADILHRIMDRGDDALIQLTRELDDVDLDSVRVGGERIEDAYGKVDPDVIDAVERAAENIRGFHEKQVREGWTREVRTGVEVGRNFTPLNSVGAYVPGGTAAYPSTALMTVIPAKVAGVERVIACTPPRPESLTLVALDVAGVDEVYEVGGPQSIGAMAYGTETIESVDKIVGPGNRYVTAAKELVNGDVLIDFLAGPTEIGIIADETAKPRFVAAD
ncbi:MAG: histidinol dehydrogenase, partial [Halobacteria archaeon]|nr:histidinol dehydrogenase [Halobacteria archaeon]